MNEYQPRAGFSVAVIDQRAKGSRLPLSDLVPHNEGEPMPFPWYGKDKVAVGWCSFGKHIIIIPRSEWDAMVDWLFAPPSDAAVIPQP